ncbi:MAG: methyltransferase domain-containing protein [Bryobacteraceae bacterium]|jgi:23S rRNA (guanine745-N1)-methyltransferase
MLLCPVRNCRLPLKQDGRRMVCDHGHSFDVARSGYINLLQPQDRRSSQPGDTPEAVAARRRLHDRGVTEPLLNAIARIVAPSSNTVAPSSNAVAPSSNEAVLDAGCGDGFYLGSLARQTGLSAHGVDISVPAIEAASRRYPDCQWIVANADRFVPYADRSFSLVMSITARMNASEFRRVLEDDGRLLIALPAPDDLIELRGSGHDRTARAIQTFAPHFTLVDQRRVTTVADLDRVAVNDVLHSIYRPMQRHPVEATRVTLSLDLLLFRPVQPDPAP